MEEEIIIESVGVWMDGHIKNEKEFNFL